MQPYHSSCPHFVSLMETLMEILMVSYSNSLN